MYSYKIKDINKGNVKTTDYQLRLPVVLYETSPKVFLIIRGLKMTIQVQVPCSLGLGKKSFGSLQLFYFYSISIIVHNKEMKNQGIS